MAQPQCPVVMLHLVMVPDCHLHPLPADFQLVPSKLDCQYKLPRAFLIMQSQAHLWEFLLILGQLALRVGVSHTLWFLAPSAKLATVTVHS